MTFPLITKAGVPLTLYLFTFAKIPCKLVGAKRKSRFDKAAGMNTWRPAKAQRAPVLRSGLLRRMERRVGFGEFCFDTPQLAEGASLNGKKYFCLPVLMVIIPVFRLSTP
jgi:hypothetical protein